MTKIDGMWVAISILLTILALKIEIVMSLDPVAFIVLLVMAFFAAICGGVAVDKR